MPRVFVLSVSLRASLAYLQSPLICFFLLCILREMAKIKPERSNFFLPWLIMRSPSFVLPSVNLRSACRLRATQVCWHFARLPERPCLSPASTCLKLRSDWRNAAFARSLPSPEDRHLTNSSEHTDALSLDGVTLSLSFSMCLCSLCLPLSTIPLQGYLVKNVEKIVTYNRAWPREQHTF